MGARLPTRAGQVARQRYAGRAAGRRCLPYSPRPSIHASLRDVQPRVPVPLLPATRPTPPQVHRRVVEDSRCLFPSMIPDVSANGAHLSQYRAIYGALDSDFRGMG